LDIIVGDEAWQVGERAPKQAERDHMFNGADDGKESVEPINDADPNVDDVKVRVMGVDSEKVYLTMLTVLLCAPTNADKNKFVSVSEAVRVGHEAFARTQKLDVEDTEGPYVWAGPIRHDGHQLVAW
jgi:hypothetical protein